MMWGRQGQHVETTDHGDHMGTFWGLWGQHVGRMTGTTGTMWGQQGQREDDGTTWGQQNH